jgi:hypothetical protein
MVLYYYLILSSIDKIDRLLYRFVERGRSTEILLFGESEPGTVAL